MKQFFKGMMIGTIIIGIVTTALVAFVTVESIICEGIGPREAIVFALGLPTMLGSIPLAILFAKAE